MPWLNFLKHDQSCHNIFCDTLFVNLKGQKTGGNVLVLWDTLYVDLLDHKSKTGKLLSILGHPVLT